MIILVWPGKGGEGGGELEFRLRRDCRIIDTNSQVIIIIIVRFVRCQFSVAILLQMI